MKDVCVSKDPRCGAIKPGVNGINRTMESVGAGIAMWARILTQALGRPVYDKTELGGTFGAMHLEYARRSV